MSQSRLWPVAFLALTMLATGIPSPAFAQASTPPSPEKLGTDTAFSNDAVDLAVDLNGRYSVVAVKPSSSDVTGAFQHLYVFDMTTGVKQGGTDRYPFGGSDDLLGGTPPVNGGVVGIQDSTSPSKYAVGAGHRVATYNLGGGRAALGSYKDPLTTATVVGVVMNGAGTRIAAGINYANPPASPQTEDSKPILANLTVLDASMNVVWRHSYSEAITAMALRDNTLVVATKNKIHVYAGLDVGSAGQSITCTTGCRTYSMGTSPATYDITSAMAISRDGAYLLVGTESGKFILFRLAAATLAEGVRLNAGFAGDGKVKGVVMNGDGANAPTLFGVVWANRNLRVYRHDPLATTVPVTIGYTAVVPSPTGATGATAEPRGLAMSISNPFGSPAGPHPYIVVPVADRVYGFTTAPAVGSAAKTHSWEIDSDASSVLEVGISPDAERVIVAGVNKMQGYKQITRVAIIPKTHQVAGRDVPLVGKQVQPGTIVNYQFDLKNDGTTDDNYTFPWSVQPPSGFSDQRPSGIGLKAGERRTINLNVTVPAGTEAKSYSFTLLVSSRLKDSASVCGIDANRPCAIQFFANVTRVSRIEVVPTVNQPRNFTVTPDGTEFTFDVRNVGNAQTRVNLTANQKVPTGQSPWTVNLSKQFNLLLNGGTSERITGKVTPPQSALNGQFTVIEISAIVNETASGAPLALKAVLNPSYGVELEAEKELYQIPGGKKTPILVKVRNAGNTEETVDLVFNITPKSALDKDYKLEAPTTSLTLPTAGGVKTWTLYVSPVAEFPDQATITIDAIVKETVGSATVKKDSLTINIERLEDDVPPALPWYQRLLPGPGFALALAGLAAVALALRKR